MIGKFIRFPKSANLLMAVMLVAGLAALTRLNTQFFPAFELNTITVSIAWPGSSDEDADINILDPLEPELRVLPGVIRTTSVARPGGAVIKLEFDHSADMQAAWAAVEQAASDVTTLPKDAEPPKITRENHYERVATITVTGPLHEKRLKALAKEIRDGLLAAGIDRVKLTGSRGEEIRVRVRERDMRGLKLSIEDISRRIKDNTVDVPGGTIEDKLQLRLLSDRGSPDAIAAIEVKSRPSGEKIRLGDISRITTGFDRNGNMGFVRGERAIRLEVQRTSATDMIEARNAMDAYLGSVRPELPKGVKIIVYNVHADFMRKCIAILVENGVLGLLLILALLFLFLNRETALWIAISIPVTLSAALAIIFAMGLSINVISILALLMMLGIIVDDSIIVGEHYSTLRAKGLARREAAERGAKIMLIAVLAGSLTTMGSFFPILLIDDRLGSIMSAIPLVVFAVLIASMFECLLVLPGHLGNSSAKEPPKGSFRQRFERSFSRFRDGPFLNLLKKSYDWRYTTIALSVSALLLSLGLITGGHVGFTFFTSPEAENISAYVKFRPGTATDDRIAALGRIEASLYEVEKTLLNSNKGEDKEAPPESAGERPVKTSFITLNRDFNSDLQHTSTIEAQLSPGDTRSIRTKTIMDAWRNAMPLSPAITRISIRARRSGPPGRDIDVRISNAPVPELKQVSGELIAALSKMPGVSAIADDLPWGKEEITVALKPRGLALGFTGQSVGLQLRNNFEGAIATRFSKGDDEITIRVLRASDVPGRAALHDFYLTSPAGHRVPISEIATLNDRTGFSRIQRRDGVRTISVTADIDRDVTTLPRILNNLERDTLAPLAAKLGIKYTFKGRAEERKNSFKDLRKAALLALVLIYVVLVFAFNSYIKPVLAMAIIPLSAIGVIVGHWLMGFDVTIISLIGLLGLSGIVVNGSIILMRQIDRRLLKGDDIEAAVIGASRDRLRAVLLTSLTTICGLVPLLFETSRQAQFLIPMAITQVFGLAIVSMMILFLVPALIGVGRDIGQLIASMNRARSDIGSRGAVN